MATRLEFSKKTKALAALRCEGKCEECGDKLVPGQAEYDHITPAGLGGDASLENCKVLCRWCHASKTHGKEGDRQKIRKADRVRAKHTGERQKSKAVLAGTRRSKWKRKLNGKVVRRDD